MSVRSLFTSACISLAILTGASAYAGSIAITGHDDDFHQSIQSLAQLRGMIALARNGSVLPVVTFDEGTQLTTALTAIGVPWVNISLPANVLPAVFNATLYSAMAVASDTSCGGCDNTAAMSTALAAQSAAIATFLNAGRGIVALAGGTNAGYYAFLPQTAGVPVGAPPSTGYFQTPVGLANSIPAVNGDPTHNVFSEPGSGGTAAAYQVAERLTAGAFLNTPETLICVNCTTSGGILNGGAADTAFQIRYASNLTSGDSVINITNTGANGASLNGPGFGGAAGNICVNVYAFSPDEQLISCCSCLITPNGLVSLSVTNDLISNTLTGVRPNSVVIKLVNTGATDTFTGTTCTNSAALATIGGTAFPIVNGMLAYGTTIHTAPGGLAVTETPFLSATLSEQELASIKNRCTNIIGNGSTFGICRSCRVGGLGATR